MARGCGLCAAVVNEVFPVDTCGVASVSGGSCGQPRSTQVDQGDIVTGDISHFRDT